MERCDRVLARKTKFPIGMGTKAEDITGRRGTTMLIVEFGSGSGLDGRGGKAGSLTPDMKAVFPHRCKKPYQTPALSWYLVL